MSVRLPLWVIQPGPWPSQPGLKPEAWLVVWLDSPEGGTDGRTDVEISLFYRTLSPIKAAALLPKRRSRPIKRSRARVLLTT